MKKLLAAVAGAATLALGLSACISEPATPATKTVTVSAPASVAPSSDQAQLVRDILTSGGFEYLLGNSDDNTIDQAGAGVCAALAAGGVSAVDDLLKQAASAAGFSYTLAERAHLATALGAAYCPDILDEALGTGTGVTGGINS